MSIEHHLRPQGTPPTNGYSHAVSAQGRTLYVSGQVALDPEGNVVGAGDAQAQLEQVFRNLDAVLAGAGASMRDVVKLTLFLKDINDLPAFRTVRDTYLDPARPPASSAVQVVALALPDLLVEVEAVAVLPD